MTVPSVRIVVFCSWASTATDGEAEDRRRESLDGRGTGVITSSGVLVRLLLALAGFSSRHGVLSVTGAASYVVGAAGVLFVLSCVCALATLAPQPTRVTLPDKLAEQLRLLWDRGSDFARKKVTATRLEQLAVLQTSNDRKALAVLAAVMLQVLGVLLLAIPVVALIGK